MNLTSRFAKSTVPSAQTWIGFTQEYSAEVVSVMFNRSYAIGGPNFGIRTPSAKNVIFLPSSVVLSAWK